MLKGFCISVLFDGHNSIDSAVSGGVTIIFGIVRAISAAGGVIIIVGLVRVSTDSAFLVWGWMVLIYIFFCLIFWYYQGISACRNFCSFYC